MTKRRKLRRYTRKDYSEVVDFPVEIVGRDGAVRRYSFEQSVRLYQRRIETAANRYGDLEVVQAEVSHCEQRIRQLRQSYFSRFGWASPSRFQEIGRTAGEYAGEVLAFLRRYVTLLDDAEDVSNVELLEESDDRLVYFLRTAAVEQQEAACLLYLYRFRGGDGLSNRQAFFEYLQILEAMRGSTVDVERLAAFHHSSDCGLILTSASGSPLPVRSPMERPESVWVHTVHADADPFGHGLALLRQGNRKEALGWFARAYEAQHFHRGAYVGAFVLAEQLERPDEAATAALMGSRYFPDDPVLWFHVAVSELRQRSGAHSGALERVVELAGASAATEFLAALRLLQSGRLDDGRRALFRARERSEGRESEIAAGIASVQRQLAGRDLTRLSGAACIALGLVLTLWGFLYASGLAAAGVALVVGAHRLWVRRFDRLLRAGGVDGLRLANPSELHHALPSRILRS